MFILFQITRLGLVLIKIYLGLKVVVFFSYKELQIAKLWKPVSATEKKKRKKKLLRLFISQFWLFLLRIAWYKLTIASYKVRIAIYKVTIAS